MVDGSGRGRYDEKNVSKKNIREWRIRKQSPHVNTFVSIVRNGWIWKENARLDAIIGPPVVPIKKRERGKRKNLEENSFKKHTSKDGAALARSSSFTSP